MARLMICSTAGCGEITTESKCRKHRVELERPNKEQRKPYYTARWVRVRDVVLERDNYLCQQCLKEGRTTVGNQVDHITRAMSNPENFWAIENLQTLCHSCHSRKTQRGE